MSQVILSDDLFRVFDRMDRRIERLEHAALYDVPIGAVLPYPGYITGDINTNPNSRAKLPYGFLWANGGEVDRDEYAQLFLRLTMTANGTYDAGEQTITALPADVVVLQNLTTVYVDGNGIAPNTKITSKPSATSVGVDTPFEESHINEPVTFFPFGDGNGIDTFNLPNIAGLPVVGGAGMWSIIRAR